MPTDQEEAKLKDFLKRAEIRTMKKDLQRLREGEALKERDIIVKKVKTAGGEKKLEAEAALAAAIEEKNRAERGEIFQKEAREEKVAAEQVKDFADESEKQQIFLFEAKKLGLEKQIQSIENEKEQLLALEKNKLLQGKRNWEEKLRALLAEEQKIESDQKIITDREKESNVPAEKKSLEQRRWEIENQRQEIEKKRWVMEKEIAGMESKIKNLDTDLQKLIKEKESLKTQAEEINKTLREVYLKIIARVEEKRTGAASQQKIAAEEKAKIEIARNEKIRREQWRGEEQVKEKEFLKSAPSSLKEKLAKSAELEEEQRKKFLQNIEERSKEK